MLPSQFRLKLNNRTLRSWKNKREIPTPEFKLVYRFLPEKSDIKIGFIVSGKIGKAVQRNRVRRILTQAVGEHIAEFPKGFEAAFIVRSSEAYKNHESISNLVNKVIQKLN
ncbi:MAG: ribonuclease P protein component [Candidatus Woykebacteria bacterium RIFCSPLOWO2_01_FULL_41_12]|uniref:Ribonuclease P protein component n=1 Tax=Candidatus Woykebacteria bacterium RIFCSPLOWO2_01_FULL_41_12 TaxID=1802604 RepID=A0A1G1WWN3_9BACT|nr:MAG: ribonuclease P protein component [Candidatus Woykebacteria bacterium RIFCSPLOWO2_01_FULL_41_12]